MQSPSADAREVMANGGRAPADLAPGTVTPVVPVATATPPVVAATPAPAATVAPVPTVAPAPTATPEPLPPAATGTGATTAPTP
jgi:hypothetical protein